MMKTLRLSMLPLKLTSSTPLSQPVPISNIVEHGHYSCQRCAMILDVVKDDTSLININPRPKKTSHIPLPPRNGDSKFPLSIHLLTHRLPTLKIRITCGTQELISLLSVIIFSVRSFERIYNRISTKHTRWSPMDTSEW